MHDCCSVIETETVSHTIRSTLDRSPEYMILPQRKREKILFVHRIVVELLLGMIRLSCLKTVETVDTKQVLMSDLEGATGNRLTIFLNKETL